MKSLGSVGPAFAPTHFIHSEKLDGLVSLTGLAFPELLETVVFAPTCRRQFRFSH